VLIDRHVALFLSTFLGRLVVMSQCICITCLIHIQSIRTSPPILKIQPRAINKQFISLSEQNRTELKQIRITERALILCTTALAPIDPNCLQNYRLVLQPPGRRRVLS
jgi:hypothetical protein